MEAMTLQEKISRLIEAVRTGKRINPRRLSLMRVLLEIPERFVPTMLEVATVVASMTPSERKAMRAAIDVVWPSCLRDAEPPTSTDAES